MNKLSFYNIASLVLPFLSLLIASGVVFYEVNHLSQSQRDYTSARQQIAIVDRTLAAQRQGHQDVKRATVAPSHNEQTDFLNWLRTYAARTRVQIIRWSNAPGQSAASAPAQSTAGAPGAVPGLPAGVTAIDSTVEVKGAYNNIRQFLYNVERDSPRLLNLSNTNWSRTEWPNTHLSFTLTRYTALEAATPAAP